MTDPKDGYVFKNVYEQNKWCLTCRFCGTVMPWKEIYAHPCFEELFCETWQDHQQEIKDEEQNTLDQPLRPLR